MLTSNNKLLLSLATTSALLFAACGLPSQQRSDSSIKTVNLPQSTVKRQSIGNCWLYAALGWVESLALKSNGEELNLSESYLTYRFFQETLKYDIPEKELETGGSFGIAMDLIGKYGVMKEGDFIPSEANEPRSERQSTALKALNESLKSGPLAQLRDPSLSITERNKIISAELDKAFGIEMAAVRAKIITPGKIKLGKDANGLDITLSKLTKNSEYRWSEVYFPPNGYPYSTTTSPIPIPQRSNTQNQILARVKKALNDGQPVLVSWFVDFNALKGEGFDINTLRAAGVPGRQGGHITVIEDYVASGIDPETGKAFHIGEDEVSQEEKDLALKYGNIDYFVIKNSWGAKPESSYFRDGSYGYHKLMANYAFSWIPEASTESSRATGDASFGINEFVLPPGY